MDIKMIQELIELFEKSNLETLTYKDKLLELSLKKSQTNTILQAPVIDKTSDELVKSPLVGIYYAKPTPDASNYTEIGKHINKGDVLCIIESMKIMNEIKSPISGIVQAVHVEDGQMVDFDQPLFTIV